MWDPSWARSAVHDHYASQLQLYRELVRYSADLALGALTSAPDGIPHHMVISVLFRQAIAATDAVSELLEAGAVDQAHLQLRGLMEARWGLIYALRDPDKWGRHIYVASLRENLNRMRQSIPGTDEYKRGEYERELHAKYGPSDVAPDITPEHAQEYSDGIEAVLGKSENKVANEALHGFGKKYEAPWYFDGAVNPPDQVKSLRQLAKAVGAIGEYDSVYKYASYHVHGGYTGTSLSLDDTGAYVTPIRSPEGLRQTLVLGFGLLSECCLRVIRQWRTGEEAQFVKTYAEKWRDLIRDCPEVILERSRAVNQ